MLTGTTEHGQAMLIAKHSMISIMWKMVRTAAQAAGMVRTGTGDGCRALTANDTCMTMNSSLATIASELQTAVQCAQAIYNQHDTRH